MITTATSLLSVTVYMATAVLLFRRLAQGAAGAESGKTSLLLLGLGAVVLHAAALYQGIFTPAGINLSFFVAASLTAWVIALLVLLAALRQPVENLGIVVLPLAALALLGQQLADNAAETLIRGTPALETHIVVSVLAYSLLGTAAVQALLLAVQDRQLRHKHPGGFVRAMPPLQVMETLLFRMIGLGFFVLSLGLLSGLLYLEDVFAQHLVHKTVLSIVAWLVFGILLWGRWQAGWRGRVAIRWTLAGFFTLLLAYFGSKLVLELILRQP